MRAGLRTRFLLAGAMLVLTTVASGLWSAILFDRMSREVGRALADTQDVTGSTAELALALEREDDALLLGLAGDPEAPAVLAREREGVAMALPRIDALLSRPDEREMAQALRRAIEAYRIAGDGLMSSSGQQDAIARYHRDVNPALRSAVAEVGRVREHHAESTRHAAAWARDEATRATGIVTLISLAAFVLSVVVALHLARVIVWPLKEITRGVEAMRQGDFEHRLRHTSGDELGRLAEGFNRMAENLAEFRRSNLGEVMRARDTLEATLEALPDAVVVIDPEGFVSSANEKARLLLGAARFHSVHFTGLPLTPQVHESLQATLRGEPTQTPEEGDLSRAIHIPGTNEERQLLPRAVVVPGFSAGRPGAVLVLSDVTDWVRLNETRVELVAVASHELRTPLTTLRMTLLMLREGASGLLPRQQDLLATALLGVEQLSTTIDEFLDLTRLEAGQLRLTWDRVDAASLVGQTLRTLRPRCEEAGVSLQVALAQDLPGAFRGDSARLQSVLSNILTNALKYTPRGGVITVSATRAQGPTGGVELAVTDTGVGIPEEYRERIFEKFFRVEHYIASADEGVKGSGIGLYLARQIVEAHGGSIRCEPGALGQGTTIAMVLPDHRNGGAE